MMVRRLRQCRGHWVAVRCGPTGVTRDLGLRWVADVELVVMVGLGVSSRYA
jgi:hypothetical protein